MSVDYSAYQDRVVHGLPRVVLQRGHVLVRDGQLHARPGDGRFLPRAPGAPA